VSTGGYLKMADRQRILALLDLGRSYRRIERETGVRERPEVADVLEHPPGQEVREATLLAKAEHIGPCALRWARAAAGCQ